MEALMCRSRRGDAGASVHQDERVGVQTDANETLCVEFTEDGRQVRRLCSFVSGRSVLQVGGAGDKRDITFCRCGLNRRETEEQLRFCSSDGSR